MNYNQTLFRDHHVDIMLGMEYYNRYYRGFSAAGQGAPTDDLGDLGLTDSGEGMRAIDSYHEKWRILSFFGCLNYDFQEKYLVSFVFRQDGYSSLLGDNRWGFFQVYRQVGYLVVKTLSKRSCLFFHLVNYVPVMV